MGIGRLTRRTRSVVQRDVGRTGCRRKADRSGRCERGKRRYDLATWHRIRGENAVAIAKYKSALSLRPDFKSARNDLAALLCVRGELGAAENEYAKIIEIDEKHRPALKGLALVQAKKRNYRSAHDAAKVAVA
ncbi:MAG: tetratricopeptide repeat protein [Planctomycetes bacterium]|nr:tetratricopeptide repeat protein [Planctomycetota bacterium]